MAKAKKQKTNEGPISEVTGLPEMPAQDSEETTTEETPTEEAVTDEVPAEESAITEGAPVEGETTEQPEVSETVDTTEANVAAAPEKVGAHIAESGESDEIRFLRHLLQLQHNGGWGHHLDAPIHNRIAELKGN